MSEPLVIGLTGSTGAGKSEVSRLLLARGFAVIDADVLARRAVEPGMPALGAIAERFTAAVLREDGSLDRAALAAVAFASPEATADLNAIVHPAVIRLLHEELKMATRNGARVVVLDVPLLFQSGLDALCAWTVAVTAPPEVRRERIRARDGLSEEQANARMQAQPADAYYAERATYTLVNDADREALRRRVDEIFREVTA